MASILCTGSILAARGLRPSLSATLRGLQSAGSRRYTTPSMDPNRPLPLAGIKVLELGQLVAGPFATALLGYFGAEIIKVEPPGGDAIRGWRKLDEKGTSLWWRSLARNKKSVCLDLNMEEARSVVRDLSAKCDVLVENFRPGKMEEWGLGPDDLKALNPGLIYTRISGYGQTGPYASRAGYASVCEAVGGFRFINGFPDRPPVRPNMSLGDSLAGLHAAFGITIALLGRIRQSGGQQQAAGGQVVDVAIYEAMYNMLESIVPEYDYAGMVRQPSGSTLTGIVPSNTYRCSDKHIVIGGNGDSIYKRLMKAAGREDLANDPRLANNAGRVKHQDEIDTAIGEWTARHTADEVLKVLEKVKVPAGKIYSVEDMFSDPQYQARGMFEEVDVDGKKLKIPGMCPRLEDTPGQTRWSGPTAVGGNTEEILRDMLGYTEQRVQDLAGKKVVVLPA
eukprot:comp15557_c0_seq1/m.12621 comp15557_c0_seq1/g.12621  ORF comp15557_c0_seq1/g.12621 comp15557_c0_seq1/m.12621 type:complete len:450 (-) comp15557_c0_seq1:640-1989(-)